MISILLHYLKYYYFINLEFLLDFKYANFLIII